MSDATLNEKYRAEGWGRVAEKALGIESVNVESQARMVAMFAESALVEITKILREAAEHLDYCGYGDSWERECADASGLPSRIDDKLCEMQTLLGMK